MHFFTESAQRQLEILSYTELIDTVRNMMLPEPFNQADEELAAWQDSMTEQRDAEALLEAAKRSRDTLAIYRLHVHVTTLRTRSDLLLAYAVEKMREDFTSW